MGVTVVVLWLATAVIAIRVIRDADVNWSTTGGDLRIGHFVGIHALQPLPLLAAGLSTIPAERLDPSGRRSVMRVAGLAYGALTGGVTWQALRSQALLSRQPHVRRAGHHHHHRARDCPYPISASPQDLSATLATSP
ncbi:MAG: hypothetical protein ACR2NR_00980 [Solirubrobacteraceae bacterium]